MVRSQMSRSRSGRKRRTGAAPPEPARERLAIGVPAHRDDALGAQLLRGEDAEQPDRAVAHDRDGLSGAGFGGDGGEPARAEHVGGGQQRRDEIGLGHSGRGHEGAVGERDAGVLGLCADRAHEHPVHAVGLVAGPADLARVVGGPERADDEVADLHAGHVGADSGDDAGVLVPHRGVVDGLGAAVGPEVGPADAGGGELDDRVGGLDDHRIIAILDADVAGGVHGHCAHDGSPSFETSRLMASSIPAFVCARESLTRGVPAGHVWATPHDLPWGHGQPGRGA